MSANPSPRSRADLLGFQQSLHAKIAYPAEPTAELVVPVVCGRDQWLFRAPDIAKMALADAFVAVPGAPAEVVGVVALDGTLYTLLDINLLLGRRAVMRTQKARIVFLDASVDVGGPVALLVERVLDLMPVPDGAQVDSDRKEATVILQTADGSRYFVANLPALCTIGKT